MLASRSLEGPLSIEHVAECIEEKLDAAVNFQENSVRL